MKRLLILLVLAFIIAGCSRSNPVEPYEDDFGWLYIIDSGTQEDSMWPIEAYDDTIH